MPRLGVWTGGFVLALAIYRGQTPPQTGEPLSPGQAYDVDAANGQAIFDLAFTRPGQSYLLVLGNTSRDLSSINIALDAAQATGEPQRPWRRWAMPQPTIAPAADVAPLERSDAGQHADTHSVRSAPAPQRSFWLTVTGAMTHAPPTYREVHARLLARGRHVAVYVDVEDRVDPQTPPAVAAAYDRVALPTAEKFLGRPVDLDGTGGMAVVLTGWLDRLEAGQVALGGMVRPADFDAAGQAPVSNRSDLIFLSAGVRPGRHLETLLTHELAHAVVAGARYAQSGWFGPPLEQSWLSEGMSHCMEDLAGRGWSNLDYRVAALLSQPESAPLVAVDYAAHGLARDPACRGATYLFTRRLVERGGAAALRRLAVAPCSGEANVELAAGQAFDDLLRDHWLRLSDAAHSPVDDATQAAPLSSLDLAGRLGPWGLAGPYVADWNLAADRRGPARTVVGTGVAYVRLHADTPGVYRVTVSDPAAALQVTLCPRDASDPAVWLAAEPTPGGGCRLAIRTQVAEPLRIVRVAWEPVTHSAEARRAGHVSLESDELSQWFDSSEVSAEAPLVSRPLTFATGRGDVWRIRAVAENAAGRRCCAWTEVRLPRREAAELASRPAGSIR